MQYINIYYFVIVYLFYKLVNLFDKVSRNNLQYNVIEHYKSEIIRINELN